MSRCVQTTGTETGTRIGRGRERRSGNVSATATGNETETVRGRESLCVIRATPTTGIAMSGIVVTYETPATCETRGKGKDGGRRTTTAGRGRITIVGGAVLLVGNETAIATATVTGGAVIATTTDETGEIH